MMGLVSTVALIILGISFMVFVTFFGRLPIFRRTPIAFLHRLVWIHVPNAFLAVDGLLTGGRFTSATARFVNYMLYDKHPTVLLVVGFVQTTGVDGLQATQIFFLLLLFVGEYWYLPDAWPQFSNFHRVAAAISIVLPYVFLYLAAYSDPGIITPANHSQQMSLYPYDFTIFHPGPVCKTCKFLKPARSKHCSVCKRCVAKSDHHCIFINNCVGAGNQHWFILLLLSTGVLTLYGGVLGFSLVMTKIRTRYPLWSLLPMWANNGDGMSLKQWLIILSWGLQDNVGMGAVTMLALLTTPLVWGLFGYHIYLIWCGTTTNESLKWSDWQAEMDDGYAFKRGLNRDRAKNLNIEPAWTRWPVEAEQIVVRTEDGLPPGPDPYLPGVGEWERVWKLRDVENLYDLGFWDNLIDVFVPGHNFRSADTPVAEGRGRRRRNRARTAAT